MAALGGSPVRFHLAKSWNCRLLPISPKRTEGLCLLAGDELYQTRSSRLSAVQDAVDDRSERDENLC